MKKAWSSKWKASSQPRKQRKYRHNAPLHIRRKFLSAHISRELRERFGKRSVGLRKGDEVIVMKGSFKGLRGSIEDVDMKRSKVYVEGMKRKKVDGSEVAVPIDPSNVMITKLMLDDKMRQAIFEKAGKRIPAQEKAQDPAKAKPTMARSHPKDGRRQQPPSSQATTSVKENVQREDNKG